MRRLPAPAGQKVFGIRLAKSAIPSIMQPVAAKTAGSGRNISKKANRAGGAHWATSRKVAKTGAISSRSLTRTARRKSVLPAASMADAMPAASTSNVTANKARDPATAAAANVKSAVNKYPAMSKRRRYIRFAIHAHKRNCPNHRRACTHDQPTEIFAKARDDHQDRRIGSKMSSTTHFFQMPAARRGATGAA